MCVCVCVCGYRDTATLAFCDASNDDGKLGTDELPGLHRHTQTDRLDRQTDRQTERLRHEGTLETDNNTNNNTNTTELVWRPLQTKFGQGSLTIKNKIKISKEIPN